MGFFGVVLISLLIYPYPSEVKDQEISVSLYFIYHFEEDLLPSWHEDAVSATTIAEQRLNSLNLFDDYYFTFSIGDVYQIHDVNFGNGTATPEFDENMTMNLILQELISSTNFLETEGKSNITILVFPLSKCLSRQYTIVSGKGSTPIFLSYNALLSEIHFERFVLEHEILHTFGLPDRDCDKGKNCVYPDDAISVMEIKPLKFYLSRSDYLDFRTDLVKSIDLENVATRSGSNKLPRPFIEENGDCPISVKPTIEWRLIHGE